MCVHEKHYQVLPIQMLPMSALVHQLYDRWYIYIDHQGRDTIQEEIIGKLTPTVLKTVLLKVWIDDNKFEFNSKYETFSQDIHLWDYCHFVQDSAF